ncbi:MAG: S-layer homology domain-containing protein, partial [Clostridia bacterium]|nr:S-layer homology domain-containing protein [Clostridia bacterium]
MKKLALFLLIVFAVCINTVALTVERQTLDTNASYMGGYPDGRFKPDGSVTRAEAVTVFARLAFPDGIEDGESRFADVRGHWSEDYIYSLEMLGVLDRYDGKFYPDKPITRAELVEIAVAVLKPEEMVSVAEFDDVDVTHPFYEAIKLSAESGLVGGYPDKTFRPENTITRAETVTIVNRALGISVDGNVFGQNYSRLARFTDIDGHWARYNILVASNSRIGEYLLPSLDGAYNGGISEDEGIIILQNDFVECLIESGYIVSLYDKTARRELLAQPCPFAYIERNGVTLYPDKTELSGSKIVFTLEDGTRFSVITTVKKAYISFEIADFKVDADMLVFANISLSSNGSVLGVST